MGVSGRAKDWIYSSLGIALFFAGWQLVGVNRWAGTAWPPLTSVLGAFLSPDRRGMLLAASSATARMVAYGYAIGGSIGLGCAILVHLIAPLRPGLDRLATLVNATPPIALAPIFIVLLDRGATGAAMAAIGVFFTLYVAATSGLARTTAAHKDMLRVFGATPVQRLLLADLPSALPSIIAGLKAAVSSAFIGAILGEWFGSSRGLGLLMLTAMQNVQTVQLWSAVLTAAADALIAFLLFDILERLARGRFQL
jgi:NitT/TauT family transport system permease protein